MRKFLLLIALIISGLGLNAQIVGSSSIVYYDGYSLKFTVTKLDPAECKVVCDTEPTIPVAVSIPSSVTIKGSTFSVTSIGYHAFLECSKLTSIEIPNSVTSIGNSAFYNCNGLTSIEIPNSVTSIGEGVFDYCSFLERIVVENGNTVYDSRDNCNAIIETQTNTLLYGCMNTIIPNSVTSIGYCAFYSCSGLTSIEIPNSVTSIGNYAFEFCSGLTSIEIPNSVTSIGNYAFEFCSGLTSIEIPNSVTSIGNYAFNSCSNLVSIKCHAVEVPVTAINAFNNCPEDMTIQVPEESVALYQSAVPWSYYNVTKMYPYQNGDYVVVDYEGYSLRYTIIKLEPAECEVICETKPTTEISITIPSSVEIEGVVCNLTKIGNDAFYYCSGLTSIEIPNSVTSIGNYAFLGCSHLRSIKCHAVDVPVTATDAFYDCPEDMTIQVPEESVALYQAAEPWSNYNVTKMYLYQNGDYVVVDYEGYSLRYTIIKLEPAECEVICETKPTTEISITIPSSVEMEGVVCNLTKIGNEAFSYCSKLTSIEIPNSVTSIGEGAFFYCDGLTSIEIPNSVTSIGNSAFYNCDYLTSIEIPNSVTSIGYYAFSHCSKLTSIEIPNSVTSIGNYAFFHCSGLTSIEIPNSVTSIGNEAFSYCVGLESFVVEGGNPNYDSRNNCNAIIETQTNTLLYGCMNTIIPNSVTSIGNYAFDSCSGLTSIEIPNSVTSIGNSAFFSCSGLTSIEIPNSVTSIGENAFRYCSGLTSIEIPNSVTSIGNSAFSSCDGLTSIEIPNSVTSIGNYAFNYCSKLTSIEIPNSVTSIGYYAFSHCSKLTSIEIPNSVTSIGNNAFSYCSNLTSVKCHAENVPTTKITAFNNCPEDMTIQVPEGSVALYQAAQPWNNYNVTKMYPYQIGDYVVVDYEGYSLRYTIINVEPAECEVICETKPTTEISITIPSSVEMEGVVCNVTKIGNSAFYNCDYLTSIEIPNSVTSIGNYAFDSCSGLTSIEIPNSVTSIGNSAFCYCSGLTSIGIPNSVTSIGNEAFYYCDGLTSIEIPNSVTSIGNFAFFSCDGLTSIEIPNSVTSIGNSAFFSCDGLTSIEIPNSITSIGNEAFSACVGLENFVVEGGNPNYDSRNNCNAIIETQTNTLLYGCMNTIIPNSVTSIGNSAFSNCSGLTSIEIPNSVTSIGNYAFYACSGLTSIEIPNSVTSIGNSAFFNCKGLTSIEIPNSVTSIGNEAFSSCDVLESFVVEGGNPNYDSRNNCNAIIETQTNTLLYGCMNTIIPNSVTSIGERSFIDCSKLTSTEIPNSVTSIGNYAFLGCSHLRSIKCHAVDVPVTATDAFYNCPEDMTIQVPEESVALYQAAQPWKNYNVTEILLYQIGDYVVVDYEGYSLRYTIINVEPAECEVICETKPTTEISITIPSSVEIEGVVCNLTKIGNDAFLRCSGLTSIEIPNSVTSIGNYAFLGCSGLTSIEIPNSVTSIGNSAFFACFGLTSIEIPNSITSIGNEAFYNCSGLTSIEIPNSVTSIGDRAFHSCSSLERIVVENGNTVYDSRDNCNAIIETQTNTLLYGCMNTIIPNSVTSIGNEAFSFCYGLTSIEIPNSVTSIGNMAFWSCSGLTSIEIPNSVTSIGNEAFSSCDGLESFVVEGGNPNYDSRNNCNAIIETQTNTLLYGCMNTIIPNSVTSIGERAFIYCSKLTSIEIPNSVTSIGNYAFNYCSHLRSIKCHAVDVPVTDTYAFYYCPEDMTIQVPEGSVALYQAAEPWKNYNIVAGFNSTINLTSNVEEGGFVEGGGNYQDGTEITVYAYVNPNYGFLYWSENEEIVSYSPEYTFTISNDRNLTANFAINHWIPDYTIYPNTMAVVGVVQIDGIEQNSSNIEIGAFCGNELRGSNRLFYESKYDRYYLYLTIYGKDDDEISFKIYDHTIESELKLYYNETINFSVDDNIGNVGDPMIFNFTTEFLHKRQLSSNWNWYSTFVAVEGRNGFVMLTEGLGELGIQVKSQFAFSNYSAGDWSGGLNTVSTGNMYMIKMSEPTELSMSGIIVEPSEFPIVLSRNWKWIPYPVSVPMDVTTAFAGFTPHDGDIVKSQEGFTQYYEGIGWSGSLNTMIPGEGYMYQNTSGEEKTLYYPTTGEAKEETKTNITSENNYWKPEVSKYPTNMSVIAVVDHSDEYDFEVAAFSNGECRGSARPIYIDGIDKNILFLTIYGEDNETITFRYYDANSGEEYNISNRIIYSTDSTIGNVKEPYVINLIPANINEITEKEVCIYPNPVNANSEIHLATECDKVEIYNTLGVKIAEYENINSIEGIETSGVYLIKIINEGAIKYDRIIVR